MSLEPSQEKILNQLTKQETLLSKMYHLFSKQFPQHKDLWVKLSKEEERHAKLIEKLHKAAKSGLILFDEGKAKIQTLTIFIKNLEGIIEKAEGGELDVSKAMVYAVDYESSLIEKNVFSRFKSMNDKTNHTLKILQSETIKHIERIKHARETSQST